MDWKDYYEVYLGLKLHFSGKGYDYTKYGAKRTKEESIKSKYLLLKSIEGKHESRDAFEQRLIGIFRNKIRYINELYTADSNKMVSDYISEISNWSYNLESDLETLSDLADSKNMEFKDVFHSDNEYRLPLIANEFVRGTIKYHSFAVVSNFVPFCDKINPMILDVGTLEKYRSLHDFDKKKTANIIRKFM